MQNGFQKYVVNWQKALGMLVNQHRRVKPYPADALDDLFDEAPAGGQPSERSAPATPPAQCPGCRGNVEKQHPMHDRVPGACRVANVEKSLRLSSLSPALACRTPVSH
eukprot:1237701-Karenia_brevis.AAC.1